MKTKPAPLYSGPPRKSRLAAVAMAAVLALAGVVGTAADSRYSPLVRTPWHAASRSANQTHWQAVTLRTNTVTGKVHARTNAYVELGAGLNVRRADGQFVSADPSFQITTSGAEATGTTHQVVVPADLWLGEGIKVIQPGGQSVTFQPLGLDYFDPVDGRSVLLDAVTNAVGWLTDSNEIIYSNCFTRIKASIRLRNTASGLTHDVLLHERPPDPASLGLSPDSRLEMLTEQVQGSAPTGQAKFIRRETNPQKLASMVAPDFLDADLNFSGRMKLAHGKAFSTARRTNGFANLPHPVGKSLEVIQSRRILIESIEHRQAAPALRELPLNTNTLNQTTAAVDLGSPARAASGVPNPAPSLLASQRESSHLPAIRLLPPLAAAGTGNKTAQRAAIQRPGGTARAASGTPNSPRSARLSTPAGAPGGRASLPVNLLSPSLSSTRSGGEGARRAGEEVRQGPGMSLTRLGGEGVNAAPLFVLDYELVPEAGETNFTFRGDTTYFVSGEVPLYGTTTLESGVSDSQAVSARQTHVHGLRRR